MSCAYSRDGKMIAGACLDGALHIWNTGSNFVRPNLSIEGAHVKGTETGSILFSLDGHTVLTRGGDDTVKLWDTRSFKKPVTTAVDIPTLYPGTSAIFSPDEKYVVTGAAAIPGREPGRLLFMRRDGAEGEGALKPARSVLLGDKVSAVKVVWHSKINQVTIEDVSSALRDAPIITPHALPMFRDEENRSNQRRREKQISNARKPAPPVNGPGRGGRVGASATQHIVQHMFRDTSRDEDPREALLKYATKDGEDLKWTKAWKDSGNVFAAERGRMQMEGTVSIKPLALARFLAATCPTRPCRRLSLPPPPPPPPALDYDDDAATRNESPPVTTPADHPELGAAPKADPDPDTAMASPEPLPLAYPDTVPADMPTAVKRELPADDDEHVAKRARSEGSPSAMALVSDAPAPASAPAAAPAQIPFPTQDPPPPPYTGPTQMTPNQHKFCLSSVRILKRCKDATPFLRPVDAVALNIPHYPLIIKRPMDFSTVETRLQNSNPNKPPIDPMAPRYRTADDFVADVDNLPKLLPLQRSGAFHQPPGSQTRGHTGQADPADAPRRRGMSVVHTSSTRLTQAQPAPRYESPQPKKPSVPPARRQSTSVPTIRRNTPEEIPSPVARPKREIHPPAPKDLPYADPLYAKRGRKGKGPEGERDDGTRDQLRYCQKILLEFNKKSLYQIASPFYEPVDAAYVPNYYKIIKRPMDLATMRKKLDDGEYPNANAFHNDFRLMIRNCMTFNPPGTAVHTAGVEMERIFKDKWKNLPPLRQITPEDEQEASGSDDEHSGEDSDFAIALMESQIATMKDSLAALKAKKKSQKPKAVPAPPPKEKKSPVAPPKKPARKPSTSNYAPPYTPPASGCPPSEKAKTGTGSDTERTMPIMSFEQKKELSTTIESLDGDKLERVIQIIYEGMPDLQNSNEEIELDIESLSPSVLLKLWNFVVKPNQQKKLAVSSNGPKRTSGNASKGAAATGGVKRKSMDEAVESERIRQLEAQIHRFGKGPGGDGGADANMDDDAHSSAGSASDSDSGSESD
ncbi:bromodomain associated protein [Ceratobasidium sp. AG-Ba]|nr:bromodomain associated protein [Ceratobasidium sp. AG-Ba]